MGVLSGDDEICYWKYLVFIVVVDDKLVVVKGFVWCYEFSFQMIMEKDWKFGCYVLGKFGCEMIQVDFYLYWCYIFKGGSILIVWYVKKVWGVYKCDDGEWLLLFWVFMLEMVVYQVFGCVLW